MAVFEYKGLNKNGKSTKGVVEADGLRAARNKLKTQGIFPTEIFESSKKVSNAGWNISINFQSQKVSTSLLAVATRQLATLVSAGMPLVESLRSLSEQIDQPSFRGIISEIADFVNEGSTLANGFRKYPKIFPRLYTNMVASAEASGSLDLVLERLADLLEAQAALKRKVFSALTYPVLMLLLCFGVVILLLAVVVPQITQIFAKQKAALPLPTEIIIQLSDFTKAYWWLLIILAICAVIGFRKYYQTTEGKKRIDRLKLSLPLFGTIQTKVATARFARNLSSMLSSGIEILTALSIVRNILGNVILEKALDDAIDGVREGRSLAGEIGKCSYFPRLLIRMIAIGEKTGQLDQMLARAAKSYESEVDAIVSGLTSILEPILIVVLAAIVGGILAAVMLPMLEMSSLTGI